MSSSEGGEEQSEWKKGGERFQRYLSATLLCYTYGQLLMSRSKRFSEYFDPCQEAADRSLKCLRRNGGDRGMCTDYFQAYKDCKQQWARIHMGSS